METILVFVAMWIGDQHLTLSGETGFNRYNLIPEELSVIGMDSVARARQFDRVDRVTVEWEGYRETWTKRDDGSWVMNTTSTRA